ncbi:MAG: bifunctional 5,10-methylenetetrahydrofolate dehydrogenase/5,10-methenyltetrahydrofolate cyclohydrolase [Rickettsiales bacterium]|nr:bifunctional 5,10-methylenetetrahydrofolate dehydrogenase/5,10-methenyltetrahydrofolate cyclohydrolase [Rickettsiales bacterium]MCA0254757.1 bifunctional 5,10-methylenetetrahydrofolate dehydrogenase/5,10-methenyltetrahydrofolate cyclohydrolase [Pseudomonadota bacterium]
MLKNAIIIDGKKIASDILADLKAKINQDKEAGLKEAKLSIFLVGNSLASRIYVENKIRAATTVGINTELIKFDDDIPEKVLLSEIEKKNQDKEISGIIVQLPLPEQIDKSKVMFAISPDKDVDGFHPLNLGLLYSPFKHKFVPCTAMGCLKLINSCIDDLTGKNVVMIGRSNIVGRPLAALLLKEHCSVMICHSYTNNLQEITSRADIVISAVGRAKFLTKEYFNTNCLVIDVGINRISKDEKVELVGDVDFEDVLNHVSYITPVPGGVGPMTVAYLLVNTYTACVNQRLS